MKTELFPFQKIALHNLRVQSADALGSYHRTHTPQVVSFTAPTGAGKTVILAALIESIFHGDAEYPDQNDAIFVWLSDSPELNLQSKGKIESMADKIRIDQCVEIKSESFDQEVLDDGHIYFLNTQKLGKSSNLTQQGDQRTYTIWKTLQNTMDEKYDRLYFIIDEAHRGMQGREAAKATSIMQKFLKGSREDNLAPAPLVIGVTATPERFNNLVAGTESTIHKVVVTADEVRASGLLKDRIIIAYPEDTGVNKDMAVLQAAADDWREKWEHWTQYCYEQHYAYVNPVFVIQVQNQSGSSVTETDLDDCLKKIEERVGIKLKDGEVVHTFGQTTATLHINGIDVYYCEPSRISEEKNVKIVFFKENLSTGWDCPRAETMMSFRRANDATYIAQLLGRMVRTPMQMHIMVDDVLNDVHLFLPYFNADTVESVVKELQSTEGGDIPTDVIGENFENRTYDTWSIRPATPAAHPSGYRPVAPVQGQTGLDLSGSTSTAQPSAGEETATVTASTGAVGVVQPNHDIPEVTNVSIPVDEPEHERPSANQPTTPVVPYVAPDLPVEPERPEIPNPGFDREAVVKAINDSGLLNYQVRSVRINDYLKSLLALARLLVQTNLNTSAHADVTREIVQMIHQHIRKLKELGKYDDLATQVKQFKLKTQTFDVFGEAVMTDVANDFYSTTDTDLDRQFRLAEKKFGDDGIGMSYISTYCHVSDIMSCKIDVIIFTSNQDNIAGLYSYAADRFHDLDDQYRRRIPSLTEKYRKRYDSIVADGDIISKHNFRLPEVIQIEHCTTGKDYIDHLFVDPNTGKANIVLNNWEQAVLRDEQSRHDYVCWLRNPPRKSWALCIPYEQNGETKAMYPDFIIIRKEGYSGYVIDILEPHDGTRTDNLGKAKGFAEYAKQNPGVGRIQLIRLVGNTIKRLDMSKSSVREKVVLATTSDQLDYIFDEYSF